MDEKLKQIDNIFSESKQFHKNFQTFANKELQKLNISFEQLHVLYTLDAKNSMNLKELAKCLKVSSATLSVRINKMVEEDLLFKKTDDNDKRNSIICLTDKGIKLAKEAFELKDTFILKIFEGVSIEEIEAIVEFMKKLRKGIGG